LFTFRVTTPNSQQDVFVAFQGRAALFSYFRTSLPITLGASYDYAYGTALQ
jgi:hypothetical protein